MKFQVAFLSCILFAFAPHAGAGTCLAAQKQALCKRSCFNFVKTNRSNEGFVFASQKLVFLRRPRFLCFAKEKEAKERQVWLRQTSLTARGFSGGLATCGCAASNMQALVPRKTVLRSAAPAERA